MRPGSSTRLTEVTIKMARCDFCSKQIPPATGVLFVKKDGKKLNFCSRKCEKNMIDLKRKNPRWGEKQ